MRRSIWVQYSRRIALERTRFEMLRDLNIYAYLQMRNINIGTGTSAPMTFASTPSGVVMIPTSLEIRELTYTLLELQELEERYMFNRIFTSPIATTHMESTFTIGSHPASAQIKLPPVLLRIKFQATGKKRLDAVLKDLCMQIDNLEKRLGLNLALSRMQLDQTACGRNLSAIVTDSAVATPSSLDPLEHGSIAEAGGTVHLTSLSTTSTRPFETVATTLLPHTATSDQSITPNTTKSLRQGILALHNSPSFSSPQSSPPSAIFAPPSLNETLDNSDRFDSHSVRSSESYDRDDNYSVHTLDWICRGCRRVCRGGGLD